jgi:hypothetical protein
MQTISKHNKIFASLVLLVANLAKRGFCIKLKHYCFVLFCLVCLYFICVYLNLVPFVSLYRLENLIKQVDLAIIVPFIQHHRLR